MDFEVLKEKVRKGTLTLAEANAIPPSVAAQIVAQIELEKRRNPKVKGFSTENLGSANTWLGVSLTLTVATGVLCVIGANWFDDWKKHLIPVGGMTLVLISTIVAVVMYNQAQEPVVTQTVA